MYIEREPGRLAGWQADKCKSNSFAILLMLLTSRSNTADRHEAETTFSTCTRPIERAHPNNAVLGKPVTVTNDLRPDPGSSLQNLTINI